MEELYYQQTASEVLKRWGVSTTGLPLGQTVVRLRKYGPNRLPVEKSHPAWKIFFRQFQNVLVYILIIAAIISFLLQEFTDGIVIAIAVVVNVLVGFVQEHKAQRSLESLRLVLSSSATVMRDGKPQTIDAEQVVPGDLIQLQAGDKVPADARVIECHELEVSEASLTGESEPVQKTSKKLSKQLPIAERFNMVYSGTVVTGGTARAVVTATGLQTEIGNIASLIKETPNEVTPLQDRLSRLAKWIGVIVLCISTVIVFVGVINDVPFQEVFTTAVAIAVSAIPEGLVISVTVVLAVGMQRILKRQGLVRALLAAETLGSTDVVCTDKTGTLTAGKMEVVEVRTGVETWHLLDPETPPSVMEVFRLGMLCNEAVIENPQEEMSRWEIAGNLTDRALYAAGISVGLRPYDLQTSAKRLSSIPFSSSRKYMATLHEDPRGTLICIKGAPEHVLDRCTTIYHGKRSVALTPARRAEIHEALQELAGKGLRTLAIAYKKNGVEKLSESRLNQLVFLGILGIQDPLRPTSSRTVKEAISAGIRVVMVTGDLAATAMSIAKKLKLPTARESMVEGPELDQMSDMELSERIDYVSVFSRVAPEHKIRIVGALQSKGHVVAMTGDGVNDAPALKKADIGVALGSGTQVAKDSSDLVLLNDDFSTIIAAVREGRLIFHNIQKVLLYLMADSLSSVVMVMTSLLMGFPLPITATQILWVNLTTDVFPALALTTEPEEPGLMDEPPRHKNAQIINRRMRYFMVSVSLLIGVASLLVFGWARETGATYDHARTLAFMTLGVSTIFYVFSVRSTHRSVFQTPLLNNPNVLYAVAVSLALQIVAVYILPLQVLLRTVPLNGRDWLVVMGVSLAVMTFVEVSKAILHLFHRRRMSAPTPAR